MVLPQDDNLFPTSGIESNLQQRQPRERSESFNENASNLLQQHLQRQLHQQQGKLVTSGIVGLRASNRYLIVGSISGTAIRFESF